MPSILAPLGLDVVIHPLEVSDKTTTGRIYLPPEKMRKIKINQGIVVGIGPQVPIDIGFETGDHVIFNGYAGDQVTIADSGQFYILPASLVLARIEPSNVRLLDTKTVSRIISERFSELRAQEGHLPTSLTSIEESLYDRIDSFVIAEQYEF